MDDNDFTSHPFLPPKYPLELSSSSSSSSEDDDALEELFTEAQVIQCEYLMLEGEEEEKRLRKHKRVFVDRDFDLAAKTIDDHYFCANAKYSEELFRRRFRMRKPLFLRIEEALMNYNPFFQKILPASYRSAISPRVKIIAALRMLSYGVAADSVDEYLQIGKTTTHKCLDLFCDGIYEIFGPQYLREPNSEDLHRLLEVAEHRNFPGMIGSIDCMHWKWKNCPKALQGTHKGHANGYTVILEAVASYDTWIWHAHFGIPGSNNDLNVLDKSPLFNRLAMGNSPNIEYKVNGKPYNWGYYLGDGIYPPYATIVKGFTSPAGAAQIEFTRLQAAYRKDVERAFGILQARFAIVREPARAWSLKTLGKVMKACIILHNMIVEDERHTYKIVKGIALVDRSSYYAALDEDPVTEWFEKESWNHGAFWNNMNQIKDGAKHFRLREDLVAHVWAKSGGL